MSRARKQQQGRENKMLGGVRIERTPLVPRVVPGIPGVSPSNVPLLEVPRTLLLDPLEKAQEVARPESLKGIVTAMQMDNLEGARELSDHWINEAFKQNIGINEIVEAIKEGIKRLQLDLWRENN